MIDFMDGMIGSKVVGVESDLDGLHIKLNSKYWISIFNKFEFISDSDGVAVDLIGATLLKLNQTCEDFTMEFDLGRVLKISLLPEAYNGPEAANFFGPSGEVVAL